MQSRALSLSTAMTVKQGNSKSRIGITEASKAIESQVRDNSVVSENTKEGVKA